MAKARSISISILLFYSWILLSNAKYYIFHDSTKPVSKRVKDLLKRMSLEEKIGQMTQIERSVAICEVLKNYKIGSVLSGGGSFPSVRASAKKWVDMVNNFQNGSLSTCWKIPMLYGIDAVHGHNNVYNANHLPS